MVQLYFSLKLKFMPTPFACSTRRLNGVPQYQIPEEELAFAIGEELKGNNFKGWTHHRKKVEY